MRRSPRVIWLEENVRGETILDIGFVGEYEESFVHKRIADKNLESTIIGFDKKAEFSDRVQDEAIRGDLFRLPFNNQAFDAVVFAEVLEHITNPVEALSEISRVLSPGGQLFLTTPNPFGFYRYLRHYLLKPNFDVEFYLGAEDHCLFLDPLSLSELLRLNEMEVEELTFRNVSLPKFPTLPDWSFLRRFPFNRGGSYTCIIAVKTE